MSPYRTPASREPPAACAGFAFPSARVRVAAGCFELSFWDPWLLFVLGVVVVPYGGLVIATWFGLKVTAMILIALAALSLACRTSFVVTRETSWVTCSVLGLRWTRRILGRTPVVENLGYDWEELAVTPSDPALRVGLHDDERVVLASWTWGNERKTADSKLVMALVREHIRRLHRNFDEPWSVP